MVYFSDNFEQWNNHYVINSRKTSLKFPLSPDANHYPTDPLWRIWDDSKPHVLFIGLNPSTADETTNDPTITRCSNFAKDWGYGGLCMVNLFAFRATQPSVLVAAKDPIGSDNDSWILKLAEKSGVVVAAWGNDGSHMGRSKIIIEKIPNLMCLKINKTGEPAHPLYQPASATLTKMKVQSGLYIG